MSRSWSNGSSHACTCVDLEGIAGMRGSGGYKAGRRQVGSEDEPSVREGDIHAARMNGLLWAWGGCGEERCVFASTVDDVRHPALRSLLACILTAAAIGASCSRTHGAHFASPHLRALKQPARGLATLCQLASYTTASGNFARPSLATPRATNEYTRGSRASSDLPREARAARM